MDNSHIHLPLKNNLAMFKTIQSFRLWLTCPWYKKGWGWLYNSIIISCWYCTLRFVLSQLSIMVYAGPM